MLRSPTEYNTDGHSGDMPPRILLTPEAANALPISRSRLYELVRSGTIESVRIDRLRRIPTQPSASTSIASGSRDLRGRKRSRGAGEGGIYKRTDGRWAHR
jgi:excisionase family DNA binding protein